MKILSPPFTPPHRLAARGLTLVEMIIAISIFSLVILATVAIQIYASRVYTLAATTLNAAQQARITMNDVRDKIREARIVYVGNYTLVTGDPIYDFSSVTNGGAQQGNAIMIYPTTATNSYSLIYLNLPNNFGFTSLTVNNVGISANYLVLLTYTNGVMQLSNNIANFITNQVVFDAENFEGAVLSTNENNYLIHMKLCFAQSGFPMSTIGTNYYQLNTIITRRDTD
jgi:prepilin-type N-terminal cleavage/methylation domain-containing protein